MLQINKEANGREVEVCLGDTFEVGLPENPTTGFRWRLLPCGTPIEIKEDTFEGSKGTPGAGGFHHWRFGAVKAGIADVKMEYKREWEERVAETFSVTVRVKPR